MFTGIITDVGEIVKIENNDHRLIRISCSYKSDKIDIGSSIACSGVCLTVIQKGKMNNKSFFDVEVSKETDDKTTSDSWDIGTKINLEQSLKVGSEIGGHFVYGHVDCIGEIIDIYKNKNSNVYTVKYPKKFSKFIVEKGSVALGGISLTINEVRENSESTFSVNIIPHTKQFTTWSDIDIKTKINLEVDPLARYVLKSK